MQCRVSQAVCNRQTISVTKVTKMVSQDRPDRFKIVWTLDFRLSKVLAKCFLVDKKVYTVLRARKVFCNFLKCSGHSTEETKFALNGGVFALLFPFADISFGRRGLTFLFFVCVTAPE